MKKQNLLKLSLLVLVLLLTTLRPTSTFAATSSVTGGTNGPLCSSGGYFTPSSVTVASGDTITFSVPSNDPYAGGVQVNGFPQGSFVVPRGGSVTTQALSTSVSYQGTWPGDPGCIKGSGTVTVKAVSGSPPSSGSGSSSPSSSESTSVGSASSSPSSTSKSPATSTTTSTTSTSTAAPETVVADTITVAGKKVTPSEGQGLTINQSQSLVLSGTTVPNGKITLIIHSSPTTAVVQADSSGNWKYAVTGLQPGNHTIYATLTDPTNNQTSTQSKLLGFTMTAALVTGITHTPAAATKKGSSLLVSAAIAGAIVLVLAAAGFLVMKGRGRSKMAASASLPAGSPSTDTSPAQTAEPQMVISPTVPQGNMQQSVAPGESSVEEHKGSIV